MSEEKKKTKTEKVLPNKGIIATPEAIMEGNKLRKTISVEAYGGMEFEIRPLTGKEFKKAMKIAAVSKDDDPIESFDLMLELCKVGITTPGIAQIDLFSDAYMEIGIAILQITKPEEREIEDFSEAQKG
jgi:hypothetical protein